MNAPKNNQPEQQNAPPAGSSVGSVSLTPATGELADQWLEAKLSLRSELRFDARTEHDKSFVVIEDPVRSKFFQIGTREYRFIASIDGVRTPREIIEALNRTKTVRMSLWTRMRRKRSANGWSNVILRLVNQSITRNA